MVRKRENLVIDQVLIEIDQACNEFRVIGTTRLHVLKKFNGQKFFREDWEKVFKAEHII